MDKRYQVFVSSTYADLKAERTKVIQTLMEMDCIPSGMELFPAADEEQWEFIKKVINDCDYYLLIIGGRYGSTSPDGLSYTEKEYDYAVERGLRIIALLHEDPEGLPVSKTESNPQFRARLCEFRSKVATGRLVKFWKNSEDLPGSVALSLSKTIKMFPATGWVRADQVSNENLLGEINEIRKENAVLKSRIQQYEIQSVPNTDNLASIDEEITLNGKYFKRQYASYIGWKITITWRAIFALVSPFILKMPSESFVESTLGNALSMKSIGHAGKIDEQHFQTVKVQLMAYGLVNIQYVKTVQGGMDWFWSLTPKGTKLMIDDRTIKKKA